MTSGMSTPITAAIKSIAPVTASPIHNFFFPGPDWLAKDHRLYDYWKRSLFNLFAAEHVGTYVIRSGSSRLLST